jgi:hypothetical protein
MVLQRSDRQAAVGGTWAEVDSGVMGGGHDAGLSGSRRAFTFLVHSLPLTT